jgi:hypothetical protein
MQSNDGEEEIQRSRNHNDTPNEVMHATAFGTVVWASAREGGEVEAEAEDEIGEGVDGAEAVAGMVHDHGQWRLGDVDVHHGRVAHVAYQEHHRRLRNVWSSS